MKNSTSQIQVGIVIGSSSDLEIIEHTQRYLDHFGVPYELNVLSAHRNSDELQEYLSTVEERGIQVIIAAAGMAAHLPGVIAAHTTLPVIGVPLSASALNGLDALFSIVQMPSGIPVGTVAIGKPGAVNAAVLAVEILALRNAELKERLKTFRENGCRI